MGGLSEYVCVAEGNAVKCEMKVSAACNQHFVADGFIRHVISMWHNKCACNVPVQLYICTWMR